MASSFASIERHLGLRLRWRPDSAHRPPHAPPPSSGTHLPRPCPHSASTERRLSTLCTRQQGCPAAFMPPRASEPCASGLQAYAASEPRVGGLHTRTAFVPRTYGLHACVASNLRTSASGGLHA
ncbi:hypothetical protein U9M48_029227 [Paspalum notatum var. saurae]|uniref:Uncharacterized protein n=1 Tax=Paspalum notatum var. saurae TaxID=547442 RepID=A0AAQ3TY84_PASNO